MPLLKSADLSRLNETRERRWRARGGGGDLELSGMFLPPGLGGEFGEQGGPVLRSMGAGGETPRGRGRAWAALSDKEAE